MKSYKEILKSSELFDYHSFLLNGTIAWKEIWVDDKYQYTCIFFESAFDLPSTITRTEH